MPETMNHISLQSAAVKLAAGKLALASTGDKDTALLAIADFLEKNRPEILQANARDVQAAVEKQLSPAFIDRLTLTDKRINEMIRVLHEVKALKDPVGEIFNMNTLPNGLKVGQMRVPIGVIAIIFESRPNVCIEVAALTIKSGNGVILKGGSDALHSNRLLTQLIKKGLETANLPADSVSFVDDTRHEAVQILVQQRQYIDLVIPRGGLSLIRFVEEHSLIPVVRHDLGVCHTYVDDNANLTMATNICLNAKVQRPGVCNAMETLLVHEKVAHAFLNQIKPDFDSAGVQLRGCPRTASILTGIEEATESDWHTEYLDLVLSVKIVSGIAEAIEHINHYGSHHSDAIVTDSYSNALQFLAAVDSATCFVNASTRFSDGNELGLGAEMGISNQKLHVRGPMGLKDLMAPKYIILGNGHIRT